jgi:hypothetical protein
VIFTPSEGAGCQKIVESFLLQGYPFLGARFLTRRKLRRYGYSSQWKCFVLPSSKQAIVCAASQDVIHSPRLVKVYIVSRHVVRERALKKRDNLYAYSKFSLIPSTIIAGERVSLKNTYYDHFMLGYPKKSLANGFVPKKRKDQ